MPWTELSDVRMYYELLGEGDPVLLIPGLGATGRMWDPISPELAKAFTLILPDNRGIGRSVPKRTPHSLADLSADLVELLDELQLDRVHVIGISLGGVIAQRLVVDHPGRVDRLVLISTAHRFGPYLRDVARLLGQSLYRMPYIQFLRTVELLGTAPCYYDNHTDEVERKLAIARGAGVSRRAVLTQLRCLAASEVVDEEFHIQSPTLVLAGEYDSLIPNCYARRMALDIPGSEFRIIEGCGHNPASENPDFVLPAIVEFLQRRPSDRTLKERRLQGVGSQSPVVSRNEAS